VSPHDLALAQPPGSSGPGTQFLAEIKEQPQALLDLLQHRTDFDRVAATMRERSASLVRLVGHGSSDNAASYAVYAFGLEPRWTALRDSITLTVHYGTKLDMRGSTVLGLSQSGRTPDVIEYVERARKAGAFTVALTNELDSPLADAAEAVLPLTAGAEHAVAATKTYLNTLAALGLLAAAVAGRGAVFEESLRGVADQLNAFIPTLEQTIGAIAAPFTYTGRMFVVGRGAEFSTAREISLKLLETCRIAAEPITATDLAHGPVAALDPLFPVWLIASADKTLRAVVEAAARARTAGATLIASGSRAAAIKGAEYVLPTPEPASPLLGPLLSIVPGQLFAWAVARAKGLDPDAPRGLTKVTLAR